MIAVLVAALALTHANARTYTIALDRLLAPTVNGHALTNLNSATRVFGAPSGHTQCTATWPSLSLALDTCGVGAELSAASSSWRTRAGLHPGDTAARARRLYPNGRSLDFLNRGRLWQLETGGAMCDGGPTLALAARLSGGRVVALGVVRVPACG